MQPRPVDARMIDDRTLSISWSNGKSLRYALDVLRASCPCADCVDEWTGEVRVKVEMFPDVTLRTLQQVGNYAFQIGFSDGHATGIFTWERLCQIGLPGDSRNS